jgi:cell division protein FtsW
MTIAQGIKKLQGDKVIWMIAVLLSLLSLLAVYSAISTLAYKAGGSSFKFLFKHGTMIAIGLIAAVFLHKVKLKYFSRTAPAMMWVSAGLLLLTLLFGVNINDASRWLKIPVLNLTFQTSDLAKIVLVVYTAKMLVAKKEELTDFKQGVLPIVLPAAGICALILPANFSTAAMLFSIIFIMMFLAGVPFRHLMKIVLLGMAGIALIISLGMASPKMFPRFGTWVKRIENFANPTSDGNYQVLYAQMAIYNGGLLPHGPGTGSSRNHLPHPYSDMIYAFVIEEYGSLLGGFGVLLLFLILLFRSIRLSLRCPKPFGSLTALGLSILMVTQAMINMAVSVNLFPTTGQALPLVSMGGTSTVFTCVSIGIILAVSRTVFNPEDDDNPSVNQPEERRHPIKQDYATA